MNEELTVASPLKGIAIPLKTVVDEAFSSEAIGKGIAIEPTEGRVVAPFDGEIISLFPTKHAIAIQSEKGIELLVHVGINTVELNGEHFESHVSEGDRVKQGQTLITFNIEEIKKAGYLMQTPVIITNSDDYLEITGNFIEFANFE